MASQIVAWRGSVHSTRCRWCAGMFMNDPAVISNGSWPSPQYVTVRRPATSSTHRKRKLLRVFYFMKFCPVVFMVLLMASFYKIKRAEGVVAEGGNRKQR